MKKRISLIKATALASIPLILSSCPASGPGHNDKEDAPRMIGFTVGETSFNMMEVKGGEFLLGAQKSDANQPYYDPDATEIETPVTKQTVGDFWLGETEVTQGLWKEVMGSSLSWTAEHGIGESQPVYNVSFDEANTFISLLNERMHKENRIEPEQNFCLPSEIEWEYAAKGGCHSKSFLHSGSDDINEVGWVETNSGLKAHGVAQKRPNRLGIYDMSGNVWEWCANCKYDYSTPDEPVDEKTPRIIRGGSYGYQAHGARNTCRGYNFSWYKDGDIGFRLCLK